MNDIESEMITEEESAPIDHSQLFKSTVTLVNKLYLITVIAVFTVALAGIACAVLFKVSLGLLTVILSMIGYVATTMNILYNKLGIAYRMFHGCITVTELYGKNRETVYIPDRLLFCTVTEIGNKAFAHESSKSIREIHLPKTLIRIGSDAFSGLDSLTDVYFEGTEEEWLELSRLAPLGEAVALHFDSPLPMPEKKVKQKKEKKSKKKQETEKTEND